MGKTIASCGHDITDYPWDWPGVWTQGFHDGGVGPDKPWSYSVLCFPCITFIMSRDVGECIVQFTEPEEFQGLRVKEEE